MKLHESIFFMKYLSMLITLLAITFLLSGFTSFHEEKQDTTGEISIGWASADITPDETVMIRGSISTGVLDPITVTALAMESGRGSSSEKVIMISCDLLLIPDGRRSRWGGHEENLMDNARELIKKSIPELSPEQIILFGTHTHSNPTVTSLSIKEMWGIELDAMPPKDYMDFVSAKIASAAEEAWNKRKPGGISYGLGHAVVGHNRLQVDFSGEAQMYGSINRPEFSHIEGYEDHSVHLLYTWDKKSNLTGVAINIASPSQVQYGSMVSSDFWHETREELGKRLGKEVYILPQTSAAGDKSPHGILVEAKGEERMQQLKFPEIDVDKTPRAARRKQIAMRISDAVTSVLPYMKDTIEWYPVFTHKMEIVELSRLIVSMDDVNNALKSYPGVPDNKKREDFEKEYEQLLLEIKENPEMKEKPGWYKDITRSYGLIRRAQLLKERYKIQKEQPKYPVEVHVIRLGDIVMATNPFELYLDYGIRMKARSPAVQTFLVQLAGSGSYLPPSRSIEGGAYGAVPASNIVGPEGGQELVESTLELINALWEK